MLGLYASGRGEWLWANLPLSRPWPLLDTKLLHPENYLQLRGSRFPDHVTTFFFPTLGQEILWLMGSNHQLKTAHTISRGMHSGPRPTIPKMGWWTVQDANVTSPILATMRPLTYISSTMWPCDPISEWPGAPQPIWGKKQNMISVPALCCTDMMSYAKKKDRQRMFITKRIKNAQKFICEKNLHGWCRSVCSHKYTFWHGRSMSFFPIPIPPICCI
jgi:hypothetical protein